MTVNEIAEKMIQTQFAPAGEVISFPGLFSNVGEDRVLLYLYKEKQHVLIGEMTEDLQLSTGRIANLLNQLEAKGLVRRTQQKDDRRKFIVSLTEKGEKTAREELEQMEEKHRQFVKKMGKKDSEELLRLIDKTFTIIKTLK